jgi:hypothetical protein
MGRRDGNHRFASASLARSMGGGAGPDTGPFAKARTALDEDAHLHSGVGVFVWTSLLESGETLRERRGNMIWIIRDDRLYRLHEEISVRSPLDRQAIRLRVAGFLDEDPRLLKDLVIDELPDGDLLVRPAGPFPEEDPRSNDAIPLYQGLAYRRI